MENSLKGLLLAAGTVITCIIIGLGFYIAREARDTASSGAGQINRLNAEFMESDKVMYDGIRVSGSEVVNVINKFKNDDLYVRVITKKNSDIYYGKNSKSVEKSTIDGYKTSTNSSEASYINPNGIFVGEVQRNENNVITGIVFTQN